MISPARSYTRAEEMRGQPGGGGFIGGSLESDGVF
jgi:hypothetical protein